MTSATITIKWIDPIMWTVNCLFLGEWVGDHRGVNWVRKIKKQSYYYNTIIVLYYYVTIVLYSTISKTLLL